MAKILGLDLGTNSIGWSLIERTDNDGRIIQSGSRIIPMDASEMSDFANGNTKSKTSDRTAKRKVRRLRERFLLRRERLHRLLKHIGFLPKHYESQIGWDLENDKKHYGTFLEGEEPKINWFKNSEGKYEFLFMKSFAEMLKDFKEKQSNIIHVPYDWTLYYLRVKALSQRIEKEELAWIILNFNQKRGYNQLRDEVLDVQEDKKSEYKRLVVKSVTPDEEPKEGKDTWYSIAFEDSDIIYRRKSKYPLEWVGKERDLIISTKLDEKGAPKLKKDGSIDYSIKSPHEDDWGLLKIRTEQDLREKGMTVGQYIYDSLLNKPSQKIRGGLVRVVERSFYKDELKRILEKQSEYHAELRDRDLYESCVYDLYKNNESHRNNIINNDFTFLILEDVLFYQRPLKSKKSLIDNCPYESHQGIDKETGEIKTYPNKCIAKSNPYFQEYRVWRFLCDLRIIANTKEVDGHLSSDVDVTDTFIQNAKDRYNLFEWLNERSDIEQKALLSHLGIKRNELSNYRWNYVEDKKYPLNTTHHAISSKLAADESISTGTEYLLWNLLYSTQSKSEIDKSLSSSNTKSGGIYQTLVSEGISESSIEKLKSLKLPDEGYGAYSEKAIKKLLSLMRMGKRWKEENICPSTRARIEAFLAGNNIDNFSDRVWDRIKGMSEIESYQGVPEWLACYIVYGRHSEASEVVKWKTPNDINNFLNNFKQHSLRNPVVESVVLETLRVVRDILEKYGSIDEIHIELGRDLKNPSDKRAQMTQRILENENTNLRIKALISEFINEEFEIPNVRPFSPSQQELLKLYEEGVLSYNQPDDEIAEIIKELSNPTKQPSRNKVLKYKCWLDQKYISPYTGRMIPLSRLFTSDYEIEHIIPQSRYFDDSFSNKVICESEVNKLKDNMLGYEFIKKHHGQILDNGIKIFEVDEYEKHVKNTYSSSSVSAKRRKLLMDEIPPEFIERQLNDSRYISKVVKTLLSNVVRAEDEDGNLEPEAISKNVITCNGSITTILKRDWGIGEVWNKIILHRFQRLNTLTGQNCFTSVNHDGKEIPAMPLELQKGFNIKRIDHRHHAMDAIVIACTTRDHVNLLNNEASLPQNKNMKYALSHKLRQYEEVIIKGEKRSVPKNFIMPWPSFKTDCFNSLNEIVVSFKQNLRVVNKATNKYTAYDESGKKVIMEQHGENHYAIRKSLHKETVSGHVNLRQIKQVSLKEAIKNPNRIVHKDLKKKVKSLFAQKYSDTQVLAHFKNFKYEWKGVEFNKIDVYYFTDEKEKMVASRFGNEIESLFSGKKKKEDIEKIIEKITDSGIQKIFRNYLEENENNIEYAFSPEGLEKMNENIAAYNGGKPHKPIYKVRMFETMGQKFPVGIYGNKKTKYVEANKGTNLFFAIYINEDNERSFSSIPLNEVIERQKQGLSPVPETDESGNKLAFYLSPGDLVYVPEEGETTDHIETLKTNRIYKLVSCTKNQVFFIPSCIASPIAQTSELGANNKAERSWDGQMIKTICIPISINRLGEIKLR